MVSIAAGIVLAANNAVGASDKQALDPIQNNTGNEPMRLAQNAAVKETKSSNTPAANVDKLPWRNLKLVQDETGLQTYVHAVK
jgi:hypothetical protein